MKQRSINTQFDEFIAKVIESSGDRPTDEMLNAMRAFFLLGANAAMVALMTPMPAAERAELVKSMAAELAAANFLRAVGPEFLTMAPTDPVH